MISRVDISKRLKDMASMIDFYVENDDEEDGKISFYKHQLMQVQEDLKRLAEQILI